MAIQPAANRVVGGQPLPEFMSFDFDPRNGFNLGIQQPLDAREVAIEVAKNVAVDTGIGLVWGGLTGGMYGLVHGVIKQLAWEEIQARIVNYMQQGAMIGGGIGLLRGIYNTTKFEIGAQKVVLPELFASTEKTKRIIQAFVEEYVDMEQQRRELDITCPISHHVMAHPVKTLCPSATPHTFEYLNIIQELQRNGSCPLCRRPVAIQDLTRDEPRETIILTTAQNIFRQLEFILGRLPKKIFRDDECDFARAEEVVALTEEVENGRHLLEADENALLIKVRNPNHLTSAEAYALSFYLVHQFKPIKLKIDEIYRIGKQQITDMSMQGIITPLATVQMETQLNGWYFKFKDELVPQECRTVRKLYYLV